MDAGPLLFEGWYRGQHARLVASLAAVFADPDLAREAADEAVLRAFERWDRVSVMASPEGWTFRVAMNIARRRLRRARLERLVIHRFRADRSDSSPAPSGELWQMVASLSERQRLAVVLRHVGGLREAEIADVMGITRGGVSSTLRAAYAHLRVALDPEPTRQEAT